MASKLQMFAAAGVAVASAYALYRRHATASAEFGSWQSPVTSEMIVKGAIKVSDVQIVGGFAYWVESRPMDGGRYVVVRCAVKDGTPEDCVPKDFYARTLVHEYGGGAYVVADGVVIASNFKDQRLYRVTATSAEPLTAEGPYRYADAVYDAGRNRLVAVCEDHTMPEPANVVNTIVAIDLRDGSRTVLASGSDFYLRPVLSPKGDKLAFIEYDHPNMPWDSTRLSLLELKENGAVKCSTIIAGAQGNESLIQPNWSPSGELFCTTDRSGWYNLHQYDFATGNLVNVAPMNGEMVTPHWTFGQCRYEFIDERTVLCAYSADGSSHLSILDIKSGATIPVEADNLPTSISTLRLSVADKHAVLIGGSPALSPSVFLLKLTKGDGSWNFAVRLVKASTSTSIDDEYISEPTHIEYQTDDGLTAFAQFYPPKNPDYKGPATSKPPLLVKLHGGPTSSASPTLRLDIQYWTTRGFAVADVDYGGSSGYGREYRKRLNGRWGIVDVADCANCAKYLAKEGIVDGDRLCIDGGSAGGFTTLAALAFKDVFRAGASLYGVSDLEALASDTHKFESRYLDNLIGKYPEDKAIYKERSPINHVDSFNCPLLILQGTEDKIVPPNQAELMYRAVKAKGIPVSMIMFEGEQHGFRNAKNIRRALDSEYVFYAKVFGFRPSESIDIVIDNL